MPPASTETGRYPKRCPADSAALQFPVHRPAALPLFEHEHAQSAVEPFIHVGKNPRRVSEMKIRFPSREIAPQFRDDFRKSAPTVPGRDLPEPLLALRQGFR